MGSGISLEELIALLRATGVLEAFYVFRPSALGQQVMWQDSAGTIPVESDGDLAGRVKDLSGNGNDALQVTDGARPAYRSTGGLHRIELDGVNDTLAMPSTSVQGMFITGDYTGTNQSVMPILSDGASNYIFVRRNSDYSISLDGGAGNTGAASVDDQELTPSDLTGTNITLPSGADFPTGTNVLRVVHSSPVTYSKIGTTQPDQFAYLSGDIYGMVVTSGPLPEEEWSALKAYLKEIGGL